MSQKHPSSSAEAGPCHNGELIYNGIKDFNEETRSKRDADGRGTPVVHSEKASLRGKEEREVRLADRLRMT